MFKKDTGNVPKLKIRGLIERRQQYIYKILAGVEKRNVRVYYFQTRARLTMDFLVVQEAGYLGGL